MNRLKLLMLGLNRLVGFYLIFLLVWLVCRWLWFDRWIGLALLNMIAFFVLLPLCWVIPWCLWQRRWSLLAGFGIPLAFAMHWYLPLFLPALSPVSTIAQPSISLKVMSFNVLWSNQDYDAIAAVIKREKPDIIGFQELRPEHLPQLQSRLGNLYPYSAIHPQPDYHTVGSLSRLPIEQLGTFPNPPFERAIQLRVQVSEQPLLVWVAHLAPSNMFSFGPRQWIAIARDRFAQRMQQVQLLKTTAQSPASVTQKGNQQALPPSRPIILLCDCNMTSTSQTYAELSQVFQDSFGQAGWGWGHTYLGWGRWPMQRIDYVWHSPELHTRSASVVKGGHSDHLPLIATLEMPVR